MAMDNSVLKIGIIGAGNLGRSLVAGFLKSKTPFRNIISASPKTLRSQRRDEGVKAETNASTVFQRAVSGFSEADVNLLEKTPGVSPGKFIISDHSTSFLATLRKQGVQVTTKNSEAASADVVIIAVKPSIAPTVLSEIKSSLGEKTLFISSVGGFSIGLVQKIIGKRAVVRIMPNLAVAVNESMTCWTKSKEVSRSQAAFVKKLLQAVGKEILCDERIFAQVTAISGSGPAYVWYTAHLLEKAAVDLGIEFPMARNLVAQTLFGSAMLASQTEKSYQELVDGVATKGGITEEALRVFAEEKLDKIFLKAIKKAYEKAKLREHA